MKPKGNAWAIRVRDDADERIKRFIKYGMASIGWPKTGDLKGCNKVRIRSKLIEHHKEVKPGHATGNLDRFVNQIKVGDAIVVPNQDKIYFGIINRGYFFNPDPPSGEEAKLHWIGVDYQFGGIPIFRHELPAKLITALNGRLTVFSLPADPVWEVINDQE